MRRNLTTLVLLASALAIPTTALAQASITGVVKDPSGAVLPGVTVEAASPVLIERVRSVTTDAGGGYRIVDLRPGPYTVTFTLTGFNTFKRDGIELTGSITAVVDASLRVGALEETITVTGEAPVVDVQNTTNQRVLTSAIIDTIPAARNFAALGTLIPGLNSGNVDVGGSLGDIMGTLSAHGSKSDDQRLLQNGSNLNDLVTAGGSQSGSLPNVGAAAEMTIDYGSASAEQNTGGVRINFIPKDGGNTFKGTTFATFATEAMASDNFTQRLKDLGLTAVNNIKKNWDVNPGVGGPLRRDQLWYYASGRYEGAQSYAAGMFYNRNAFKPDLWTYEPDLARPALSLDARWVDAQVRMTWQAAAKHKFAFAWDHNTWYRAPDAVSATRAPESAPDRRTPQQETQIVEWKSPLTNRLLVEAVGFHKTIRRGTMHARPKGSVGGGSLDVTPAELALYPFMVGVTEQSSGLTYHGPATTFVNAWVPNYTYIAAVSYITSGHNLKVGMSDNFGYQLNQTYGPSLAVPYRYRFNNGIPNQITIYATPDTQKNDLHHDLGVYAQDRWTINRMTLIGGLRFDYFNSGYPEQTLEPGPLVPNRNWTFPPEENLNWKDVTYRSGMTYDVFGNGKTAIKVSLNKYLAGQGLAGLASNTNPIGRLVNSTTRNWTDSDRDFSPDCDLTNPAANGECAAMANSAFGTQVPSAVRDLDLRQGWSKRSYNWEFSTGVQREILPRVSVDIGYFRRWYGNFAVTDDLNLSPSDLDAFSVPAPSNALLPGGGGYTVPGLFDRKPSAFGRPSNNKVTLSKNYGTQIEHWNGFDVGGQARLQAGILLQGGMSTGKTVTDNCEIVAQLPEMLLAGATSIQNTFPLTTSGVWTSAAHCHQETPFLTQFKGLGIYTVPRIDVQIAGTFQSIPGPPLVANYNVPTAVAAASLGRPLAGGAANTTVNIVEPGTIFGERINQLDLRFGKILRFGQRRATVSLDLYNATNGDTVTSTNGNYATLWRPTGVLQARFFKVSTTFDF
jgi:hypothetical protein